MSRRPSSTQALWTRGEALERAGKTREAIDLYVRAASAEEDARRPVRARLLWEQVGRRTGPSAMLLERLASVCTRAHHDEDAFDYWLAAAARFAAEGHAEEAQRAKTHAAQLRERLGPPAGGRERPALALDALKLDDSFVRDVLGA